MWHCIIWWTVFQVDQEELFYDVTLHHLVNSVSSGPRRIILRCDTASFGEQCFRWTKKNYSTYTGPQSTRAMHSFALLAATNLMTHHTPQWWHPHLHCYETQRDLYIMFITFPVLSKAGIVCSYRHRLPAEKTWSGKTWNEQGSSYGGRRKFASTEDFPPCPRLCKKPEYYYCNNLFNP